MMQSVPFQIELLVAAGLYCLVVYRFRREMAICLKSIATINIEDASGADRERMPGDFRGVVIVLASFVSGLAVVKFAMAAGYADTEIVRNETLSRLAGIAAPTVATIAAGIGFLQSGILKAAGALTFSKDFTDTLINIRQAHIAAAIALITPLVVIFSGANPVRDWVTAVIALILTVILCVSLAVQSLISFRKQKVSILVWFLYLCAVEIFPVSFALLLAIKNA